MDTLPWHVQLKIYQGIGIDSLRTLGIKPGKLKVPATLTESLGKSLKLRMTAPEGSDKWVARVVMPITGTPRQYVVQRRSDDGPIEMIVRHEQSFMVYNFTALKNLTTVFLFKDEEPADIRTGPNVQLMRI